MVFRDEMGRFISPHGIDNQEEDDKQEGYIPIDEVPDPGGETPESLLIKKQEGETDEEDNGGSDTYSDEISEEPTLYDLQQEGRMTSSEASEGNTDEGEYNPAGSQEGESVKPHLSEVGVYIIKDRKARTREESFPRVVRNEKNIREGRKLRNLDKESFLDGGEEYTEPTVGQRDDIEMGRLQEENDWKKQIKAVEPQEPGADYDTDEYAIAKQAPMRPRERMGSFPYEERTGFEKAQSRPKGPTRFWKRMFGRFRRERKDTPKNSA